GFPEGGFVPCHPSLERPAQRFPEGARVAALVFGRFPLKGAEGVCNRFPRGRLVLRAEKRARVFFLDVVVLVEPFFEGAADDMALLCHRVDPAGGGGRGRGGARGGGPFRFRA